MKPIRVQDVFDPKETLSMIVYSHEPLEDVLRRFSEESWLRGIFVINRAAQLLGVITRRDLLLCAQVRLGTALSGPSHSRNRLLRLAELMRAGTAKDTIRPDSQEAAVQADDPLDRALRLMLEMDLLAVPVVDDGGRILGDLTLSGVLRYILSLSEDEASQPASSRTGTG